MGREARSYTVPMTQSEQRKKMFDCVFYWDDFDKSPWQRGKNGKNSRTVKGTIRAGGAKIPAEKVIKNGQLVNVMTSEIYPAEIAIYKDMNRSSR